MGLFSSRPKTTAAAPARPAWQSRNASLVRRAEFHSYPIGADAHGLLPQGGGAPVFCPSIVFDFLLACGDFRALEIHLAQFAEAYQLDSLRMEELQQWLPKLFEARLLISAEDLRQQCLARNAAEPKREPARIAAIGFPTGGRPHLLRRALTSFLLNGKKFGREVEYVVADGAPASEGRAASRELLRGIAVEFRATVTYAGEEEKRRFANALAREVGCDPAIPEFALFDSEGLGFSCGANRNALLLHNAGRPCCTVDDDMICQMAAPSIADDRLVLFGHGDPRDTYFYADREDLLRSIGMVDRCFVEVHEAWLGRSMAEAFESAGDVRELDFGTVDHTIMQRLESGRVLATFPGHFGDLGSPDSYYYLGYAGPNFSRLTHSEEQYRTALRSRTIYRSVPAVSIGGVPSTPCLSAALDLRELLPPFFPVLHSEDFAYGMTCWQTCPGFLAGHLPFALYHEPGPGRPIMAPGDLRLGCGVGIFESVVILRSFIATLSPLASHLGPAERLRALGRHLEEIGNASISDFTGLLRQRVLDHESGKIGWLEARLAHEGHAPEFWSDDVEAYLDYTRGQLQEDDFDIPYDLRVKYEPAAARALLQKLLRRYGQLLQAWPELFAAARRLRENDEPLAVAI